ncbi:Uncharacterised protein [Yersinia enterocolitica]|nr:Uncharacterised protein [Yersinia enterocolitica]CNG40319.1 Uncharacterised protein [Yersinia enterocolitica]
MVLATSRKLCLRLAHAPNGTQGILISYCVMRILMKSLRSALCIITNGALWLLLSTVLLPPYFEVVQMPPPFSLFPILKYHRHVLDLLAQCPTF